MYYLRTAMVNNVTRMPLYVCGSCSKHFTRRYNASRHNRNIHGNTSEVVRFVDYIIGRLSGKYLQPDPSSCASKKWNNNNNNTVIHESNNNNLNHKGDDAFVPAINSLSAPLHVKSNIFNEILIILTS
jgi:hypothetical protein